MGLSREIVEVEKLSQEQIEVMFQLMKNYYENTNREVFEKDLSEKQWVLFLKEDIGDEIIGFSTQMLLEYPYKESDIFVLFSGDTIIQKEYWGSMGLSMAFGELMMQLIREYNNKELYWMLITKGIRTYKYLPTFFNEYYPNSDCCTPDKIKELMNFLGLQKYPQAYNAEKGVIEASENAQFLKEKYHPGKKLMSRNEELFYELNPGYAKGDELLCLTRLSFQNLKPFMQRKLEMLDY